MKKISLLAASVALALVGCGGSDGGSDTNTGTGTPSAGGIVITGFDGYFNNAVVFLDSDSLAGTKGQLDETDTVFGLTDIDGKIKLPKGTDLSTGTIALQTLKPGDMTGKFSDQQLAQRVTNAENKRLAEDKLPSDYFDTYTTDMDLPGQPMEHSVVFRSQQDGENIVISPITDLVALQPAVVYSTDKTAEQKVCDSLFGAEKVTGEACTTKLYSDFTKSDPVLHKTAQILTETKSTAVGDNYTTKIDAIAKVAMETAETLNTDKLTDPTYKPVIDTSVAVDNITQPTTTTYKTLVNADKYNEIQNSLDKLNLEQALSPKETALLSISVADLFSDKDINGTEILVVTDTSNIPKGMEFEIINNELVISGVPTEAGSFSLVFHPEADQLNIDSKVTARFSFDVRAEVGAVAPTVDNNEVISLQDSISNLEFVVGQSFVVPDGIVLDATALFNDAAKTIELSSNTNGLTIKLDDTTNKILISGRPTSTAKAGEYFIQLRATADNGLSSDVVKLDLPAIVEAIEINDHEVKLLQDKINTLDLTVGEKIDLNGLDLDITPIFNSNVGGDVEFYAGLEFDKKLKNNHEYYTTIPGVRVHTDEVNGLGTLTILGKPTEATKSGYFYVAAGINPDAENEIISKMVKITLPDVKPADEVIPPPQPENNVSMENTFLYESAVEGIDSEDGQYLGSGVSCEVRYFMSDGANTGTGEMFSSIRTVATFDECPTISKDTQPNIDERFESFGKYTVDSYHVINLQMEEEYRDDNGELVLDANGNPLMEQGNIYLSAKMFDNKFITTLKETMTPPAEVDEKPYSWLYSYAASTTPDSVDSIMAELHKLDDNSINQLENTIYFTDESGNIQPLRVDATMNSVDQNCSGDMCESGSTDADIFIKNMSCDLVKKVYSFDGYSISEYPISWGNWDDTTNSYTPNINFYPQGDSCGVDFTSYSDISLGIHTLHGEVKEAHEGKYQDIMFSFKKD
ncbi:hypothetical protein A6E05_04175 [Aliivibrio sp. 1S165]|uniref:hypothetical protein n=1 Tax=unclassified Aliivibrio TaxID=2645654 RepID=UPI00080EDE3A|nr:MULTISPECIES: hypothetical protein [unclassified Aliivibrio]OCH14381.1 hypothetical protein A6E05_04175 [Aliivibrio sp. 1S165]OCH34207.1 hypothetical protein A6E06_16555 [Aliivibrio sp. 1S175]